MIYFIEAVGTGLVKIGKAWDATKRLRELQLMNAGELRLLKALPGDKAEESACHARWAEHRRHGEWFQLAPIAADIEQLSEAGLAETKRLWGEPWRLQAEMQKRLWEDHVRFRAERQREAREREARELEERERMAELEVEQETRVDVRKRKYEQIVARAKAHVEQRTTLEREGADIRRLEEELWERQPKAFDLMQDDCHIVRMAYMRGEASREQYEQCRAAVESFLL